MFKGGLMLKIYTDQWYIRLLHRGVTYTGAGGAMAPPDFGRSITPISTTGGRLCPSNNTGTPGFSELPTALLHT